MLSCFSPMSGHPSPEVSQTHHTQKKRKKKELHQSCFLPATFLSGVELVSETNSCATQALTHPSCRGTRSVCIHQLSVHSFFIVYFVICFVFFLNKLGSGTSTLALYIAWYSDESAENIGTDLLKCFLCTSLSCSISSPHYDI